MYTQVFCWNGRRSRKLAAKNWWRIHSPTKLSQIPSLWCQALSTRGGTFSRVGICIGGAHVGTSRTLRNPVWRILRYKTASWAISDFCTWRRHTYVIYLYLQKTAPCSVVVGCRRSHRHRWIFHLAVSPGCQVWRVTSEKISLRGSTLIHYTHRGMHEETEAKRGYFAYVPHSSGRKKCEVWKEFTENIERYQWGSNWPLASG